MDIYVLSRVGGFWFVKLVSILSNETKRVEVAFTHIHKSCAECYDIGNARHTCYDWQLFWAHFCTVSFAQPC